MREVTSTGLHVFRIGMVWYGMVCLFTSRNKNDITTLLLFHEKKYTYMYIHWTMFPGGTPVPTEGSTTGTCSVFLYFLSLGQKQEYQITPESYSVRWGLDASARDSHGGGFRGTGEGGTKGGQDQIHSLSQIFFFDSSATHNLLHS